MLKPSGYLIERVIARFPTSPTYEVKKIINRYSTLEPNYKTANDLAGQLIFMTQQKNTTVKTDRCFDVLKKYAQLPNMKEYYALCAKIWPKGKSWECGRPWEEDKKPITRYFSIEGEAEDNTIYKEWARILKLKPKK